MFDHLKARSVGRSAPDFHPRRLQAGRQIVVFAAPPEIHVGIAVDGQELTPRERHCAAESLGVVKGQAIAEFIDKGGEMQRLPWIAGVEMSIVFDQEIHVVKEEAVEGMVVDERFDEADILQRGAIEERLAQLLHHVDGEMTALAAQNWECVVEEQT